MLRWIGKLFKPEVPLDYIIGDYHPENFSRLRKGATSELDYFMPTQTDDIAADTLYQHR